LSSKKWDLAPLPGLDYTGVMALKMESLKHGQEIGTGFQVAEDAGF